MSNIKVKINNREMETLSYNLNRYIDDLSTTKITYDISTNRYTYGNTGISLYSTEDILNHYFGEQANDVIDNGDVFILTTAQNEVDIIMYSGQVIGFGAHSTDKVKELFEEAVEDTVQAVVDTIIGNVTENVAGVPSDITSAILSEFNLLAQVDSLATGNELKPADYANAFVGFSGADGFIGGIIDDIILSDYINMICVNGADKNYFLGIYNSITSGSGCRMNIAKIGDGGI